MRGVYQGAVCAHQRQEDTWEAGTRAKIKKLALLQKWAQREPSKEGVRVMLDGRFVWPCNPGEVVSAIPTQQETKVLSASLVEAIVALQLAPA